MATCIAGGMVMVNKTSPFLPFWKVPPDSALMAFLVQLFSLLFRSLGWLGDTYKKEEIKNENNDRESGMVVLSWDPR